MKSLIPFALLLMMGLLAGCTTTTEETIEPVATPTTTKPGSTTTVSSTTATTPGSTTTTTATGGLQGTFISNVHPTSGTVTVAEVNGKQTLVFTNFKTDGGPDLRIYLAENTGLRNFIEVSKLDNQTRGNFSVEIPLGANPATQRYVLIWCKEFSVLFGNAELK